MVRSSVTRRPSRRWETTPELGEGRVDLRAAAVDHHWMEADVLHEHDVAGEAVAQVRVDHGVAPVLHDEDLAVEAPDVRQRFVEVGGLFDEFLHAHGGPPIADRKPPRSRALG